MPIIEGTTRPYKVLRAQYDFAVHGGAIGTITLNAAPGDLGGNVVPAGATVLGGYIDVTTAMASGTGTAALDLEAAGDILAATGQAGLTAGRKSTVPDFRGVNVKRTTAVRSLRLTIATAAFTAGAFTVVLLYH